MEGIRVFAWSARVVVSQSLPEWKGEEEQSMIRLICKMIYKMSLASRIACECMIDAMFYDSEVCQGWWTHLWINFTCYHNSCIWTQSWISNIIIKFWKKTCSDLCSSWSDVSSCRIRKGPNQPIMPEDTGASNSGAWGERDCFWHSRLESSRILTLTAFNSAWLSLSGDGTIHLRNTTSIKLATSLSSRKSSWAAKYSRNDDRNCTCESKEGP